MGVAQSIQARQAQIGCPGVMHAPPGEVQQQADGVDEFGEIIGNIQTGAQTQTSRTGAAADKAYNLQVLGDATQSLL